MRVLLILLVVATWLAAGAHAQSKSPVAGMPPSQELLRDEQILVGLVAPGAADTALRRQLQGNTPEPTAAQSVAAMIKVIDGLTLENSSQPINFDGSVLPW